MIFLINNPVIAFALLVVVGFVVIMISKIIEEVKLNNLLSRKQTQMRISNPVKGFGARIAFLSSAALAPVAAVVIMVSVALNPAAIPTGDRLFVGSAQDVLNIYTAFNDRVSINYSGWQRDGLEMVDTMDGVSAPESDSILFDTNSSVKVTTTGIDYLMGSGSDDYSETNNQVIGVDEMDNVLTDGKFIYTMYDNKVQITLAYTKEVGPSVLGLYKTFEYSADYCAEDQFYPQGMFVDGDYLVVIGNQYSYNCEEVQYPTDVDGEDGEMEIYIDYYPYWLQSSSSIKVLVYDKENDFELKDEYSMNGYFTGTRKIETVEGNSLYIVTNNYIPFYNEDIEVDDYLSEYTVNGEVTQANYEDIIYIEGTNPNAFTTFYGINLDTTEVDMETVLGDSGYNLYVSNENMYLVGSSYYFFPMIDFIETEEPSYETKTAIIKVEITEGKVEFFGNGHVEGNVLNQFSMDEYNGYLRVTTTEGWGEEISNRLFVLDENLKEVSMLEGLGKPGERIQSTRFVGDYGYVVTFLQQDPFYIINLSDPENPFIEGELSMPGFSSYMQPLGVNHVLGIGFGDNDGGTQGLKIAIYDVTDKTAPVELDNVIFDYSQFGWGNSSATYNHKDLLVSLDKGIIALPFNTYSTIKTPNNGYEYTYNSGILVFNINLETGFDDHPAYVTHATDSEENIYVYKSKFISEFFYTVSNQYIKVSTLLDPENILYSTDLN